MRRTRSEASAYLLANERHAVEHVQRDNHPRGYNGSALRTRVRTLIHKLISDRRIPTATEWRQPKHDAVRRLTDR